MSGEIIMPVNCNYGFGCSVDFSFEGTLEKIEQLLGERGFCIHTQLKLHDIVEDEANCSFGRYIILGACNSKYAQQLFMNDPNIGLLMPCNIVIYELQSAGCRVMIKDPALIMDMISSPVAIEASIQIKELLEEVIEELSK
jgi:uncharacterized protein (DUF302 family)